MCQKTTENIAILCFKFLGIIESDNLFTNKKNFTSSRYSFHSNWLMQFLEGRIWNSKIPKWVKVLVSQLCPTLCNPIDCSPPGSSVHGAGFSYKPCQESLGPEYNGGDSCCLITEPLRLQFPAKREAQAGPTTSRASSMDPAGWASPATGTHARAATSALPWLTADLPMDGPPSQTEPAAAPAPRLPWPRFHGVQGSHSGQEDNGGAWGEWLSFPGGYVGKELQSSPANCPECPATLGT